MAGITALVARTGYTGEDGFEVFVDGAAAATLWDALLAAGQPPGASPVGLGARDTLRLEAGMPLYGNELDRATNPYEAGLGASSSWTRPATSSVARRSSGSPRTGPPSDWSGSSSRAAASRATATRCAPAPGGPGVVTSGTQSPTLGEPIAMAYVAPGDAEPGTMLDVEIRDAAGPGRGRAAAVLQAA